MPESQHSLVCPLDCPGACAMTATCRDGHLLGIKGRKDHPFTQGIICGKVARYHEVQEGPRILTPLLRVGAKGEGRFRRASWDESLDLVAARLREIMAQHTPEAVFPYYYAGTMGLVQRPAVERLAHRAGFSRMKGTICYPIGFAGWRAGVGKAVGPDPRKLAQSDLVILWGINAAVTHISLMGHVKRAREQGAKLVVVDPYRTHTARMADLHLNPRPGTDGALAVAVLGVLLREGLADMDYLTTLTDFDAAMGRHLEAHDPQWAAEITGLTPEAIVAFARMLAGSKGPFIRIGLGMSRQQNGAVNVHAVSCLAAATGAWKKPGGGALFATGDAFSLNMEPVQQTAWLRTPNRILDMSRLGPMLTTQAPNPAIKALLVFSANPASSCPDLRLVHEGLAREDLFTVVHELVMSDTTRFADVVWPATTFLEQDDLFKSYGQYTLQVGMGCLPPRGEARCNHDVVNALARRLGFDEGPFHGTSLERMHQILAASGLPPLASWQERGWLDCAPSEEEQQFTHGFPQEDGRFHFYPHWGHPQMPDKPDHWPVNARDREEMKGETWLDFMTPPCLESLNTTFTHLPGSQRHWQPPRLWIHPQDAANRGLVQGQRVRVSNAHGALTMTAHLTQEVRQGLTLSESNPPGSVFEEGVSLNVLTSSAAVAPDGGAAFHDNRVEVTAYEPASGPVCEPRSGGSRGNGSGWVDSGPLPAGVE